MPRVVSATVRALPNPQITARANTESDSEFLPFGDLCLHCGNETRSGNYCSEACEQLDLSALASDAAFDSPSGLSKLPPLEPGRAHRSSSTGSVSSTPPSTPNVSPNYYMPIGEGMEPSKLNLPPAVDSEKPSQLFFDYRYSIDPSKPTDVNFSPTSPSHMSQSLTYVRKNSFRTSRPRAPSQPTGDKAPSRPPTNPSTPTPDVLRLRRTQQQAPAQPRRLSSNLISPILKASASPRVRPTDLDFSKRSYRPSQQKATSSIRQSPATHTHADAPVSRRSAKQLPPLMTPLTQPCGRPGCPSLLPSASKTSPENVGASAAPAMSRRVSAPIDAHAAALLRSHASTSSHQHVRYAVPDEGADADEEMEERGRTRVAKSRTRSSSRFDKRAQSAYPLGATQPVICLKPFECAVVSHVHRDRENAPSPPAVSASSSRQRQLHRQMQADANDDTIKASKPPARRPMRFLFGRATPSPDKEADDAEDEAEASTSVIRPSNRRESNSSTSDVSDYALESGFASISIGSPRLSVKADDVRGDNESAIHTGSSSEDEVESVEVDRKGRADGLQRGRDRGRAGSDQVMDRSRSRQPHRLNAANRLPSARS